MSASSLYDLMLTRRSVRRFKPEPPDRELIEQLIEAAVTAPSASNKQPWRFLVLRDREKIDAIAAAVREAVDRISAHIEPACVDAFKAYGDYFTRFEDAPLVIVPLCRRLTLLSNLVRETLAEDDRARIDTLEQDSGLIGTSLAIQNLLLRAHDLGLGASGMTGPLVAVDRIREILGVQPSWQVVCLIPVGHPDEEPRPTKRKPADKVTRWIE